MQESGQFYGRIISGARASGWMSAEPVRTIWRKEKLKSSEILRPINW
jgi:hypothetical protein